MAVHDNDRRDMNRLTKIAIYLAAAFIVGTPLDICQQLSPFSTQAFATGPDGPIQMVVVDDEDSNEVEQNSDVKFEGRTIEEWIRVWDDGGFKETEAAKKALVSIGEPAIQPLTRLIQDNHIHSIFAVKTLADMGPVARPALPALLELANNKSATNPEGWKWNISLRGILFMSLKEMSWASEQLLPVLERVAKDKQEPDRLRGIAISGLGGMGQEALPVLRPFATSGSDAVRERAVQAIVKIQSESGGKTKTATLQEIINKNPFDSNVPTYLANMKGIFNLGCIHPPTQRIKQIYRRELEKKPDPQIAWQLATIIRNGLAGSHLAWAAPSNSSSTRWNREDPNESFTTLAEALDVVFEHSEPNSPLWKKAGLSLAKLRLMQGDWNGMNNALRQLGQDPVPAERRPNLPAPPADWDNLKRDWQPAAEVVRSGTCGVEFRFLRRGQKLQGIPGIHVLVKKHRPDPAAFRTGFRADTIFYATLPMVDAQPYDSFGYRAADRDQTRYGVSDENGLVRITGLPKTPLLVEILVPTANFTEPGHTWDFLMATPNGLKIADRQDPRSIDSHKPPALIELQEDALLRYPIMFVRSQLSANVHDWDTVDEDFVLTWNGLSENAVDYYDVKLSLSAPEQHPSIRNRSAAIGTQTVQVRGKSWPIGQRGVGKLRLVPGNIYLLEIDAVRNDRVVAILPSLRVWVPWEHRDSKPPLTGISGSRPAVYERIFIRTNVSGKSLEVRLPDLIRDAPEMYETEYHQLCLAWLDLHKKKKGAAGRLRKLIVELPEGNVVRTTGQSFLDAVANGQALSSRLHFVGPTR